MVIGVNRFNNDQRQLSVRDLVCGGAPNHAGASRRLGLLAAAGTLFLPLFPGCNGRCRSVESIGNVLGPRVLRDRPRGGNRGPPRLSPDGARVPARKPRAPALFFLSFPIPS